MIKVPNTLTRDDTEHGVYYYRASEVNALLAKHAAELEQRHIPAGWRNRRAPKVMRAEPPHPDFTHLWEQLFARKPA